VIVVDGQMLRVPENAGIVLLTLDGNLASFSASVHEWIDGL
jgi:hypothetical protein